jgi:hypothetical protein
MTVFADTFALIAWLNPRDNAHPLVTAYLDGFTGRLVTTEWVLTGPPAPVVPSEGTKRPLQESAPCRG